MYRTQCVLALLALYVGLAHCFSWEIVLGGKNGLYFYKNGTLTHSEDIPAAKILSMTYDPVHNRVLFLDYYNVSVISSFDIATKKIQTLVRCKRYNFVRKVAYDPATETIFWTAIVGIYSFSLKPGSNNTVDGNLVIKMSDWVSSIAVDSCAGYIYWTSNSNIERIRFDGSEREVVIHRDVTLRPGLAIDQQTQTMYWIEKHHKNGRYNHSIESADLNGKNRKTLYIDTTSSYKASITVSKYFIYWGLKRAGGYTFWQLLPRNPPRDRTEPKQFSIAHTCDNCYSIAANYKVEDQTPGTRTCEALTSLLPNNFSNVSADVSLLCVHGTKVIGESVCECTQGYTGERCDVSVCQNYCFQGDCSVSDEQPNCRCNAGYSGERCEVYRCQGYCFQGGCSVSGDGQPKCRCHAGYSGERCEINACQGYCLNNGVCSLNEEIVPVCQCTGYYEGERCEVSVSVFLTRFPRTVTTLRDILNSTIYCMLGVVAAFLGMFAWRSARWCCAPASTPAVPTPDGAPDGGVCPPTQSACAGDSVVYQCDSERVKVVT